MPCLLRLLLDAADSEKLTRVAFDGRGSIEAVASAKGIGFGFHITGDLGIVADTYPLKTLFFAVRIQEAASDQGQ
jgi:hypothetical protein